MIECGVGRRLGGPEDSGHVNRTKNKKREKEREIREAACEKILSWHSASADEINSVRGCGSTMSTGHTPRFKRIERTSHTNP